MNPKNQLEQVILRLAKVLISDGTMSAAEARQGFGQSHTPEYVAAKVARESVIRGAISESCVEWVKSGRLTIMSADDALFFFDRVLQAHAFARFLHESGFEWPGKEDALLVWLLVDSWERITCLNWKLGLETG